MDMDVQALNQALNVLRQRFGDRLAGSITDAQAQMRRTLEQQMGIDEIASDRLVKELTHIGQLVYHGSGAADDDTVVAGTGPVISLPGVTEGQSGEQFVVRGPSLVSGAGPDQSGVAPTATIPAPASSAVAATPTTGTAMAGVVPVADRYAPGDAARATAENREGATMGEIGDTNVSGPTSPNEEVVAAGEDDSAGYWQIGAAVTQPGQASQIAIQSAQAGTVGPPAASDQGSAPAP